MSGDSKKLDTGKVPFETALNQAGFGLYSYLLTSLAGLCIISIVCVAYAGTLIVPTSACELGTTAAQQGLLASGPVIGMIIGGAIWGYLADTLGRKRVLLMSLASGAVVNALASISVNWVMLLVLQFFAALLASGQYTLSMTLLSESVPMARRNLVVLLVTSIFLLAQGFMALLAMPIIPLTFSYELPALGIQWNSWRTLMMVFCAPSVICFVWLCFMEESPKFVFSKSGEEEALQILRKIHRLNNRRSNEELQVKSLEAPASDTQVEKASNKELFRPPLLKNLIIMTLLFVCLQTGAVMVWLPTMANKFVQILRTGEGTDLTVCGILDFDDSAATENIAPCALNETALLIVFGVGALQSVSNLLLSLIVNRVGRRNLVIIIAATSGLCGIIMNVVPNAVGSAVLLVIFLIAMLLMGLHTAIAIAVFPTHLRAFAISLAMTGGRIMSFASIQILNLLLVSNCELGFYLFASILAASAILASFLPDERKIFQQMAAAQASAASASLRAPTHAPDLRLGGDEKENGVE